MNKIVKFAFAAAFAMFATYNVCQSNTETEETSDMVLANVEALANYETNDDLRVVPCNYSYGNECIKSAQDRPKCYTMTKCE